MPAGAIPASAQDRRIPTIFIVGDDTRPKSVNVSSRAFIRVVSALKEQLGKYGYRAIGEEEATALGITGPQTRESNSPSVQGWLGLRYGAPRAIAIVLTVFTASREFDGANKATVWIIADKWIIRDCDNNKARYLAKSWKSPLMQFPAPTDCIGTCAQEVVADRAQKVATKIGALLFRNMLHRTEKTLCPPS